MAVTLAAGAQIVRWAIPTPIMIAAMRNAAMAMTKRTNRSFLAGRTGIDRLPKVPSGYSMRLDRPGTNPEYGVRRASWGL
ncbi:hypothetical protein GCM10022288_31840 [Gryllotalpicola kribbensis]|uniref:Uncharacterized protein n=1 Tax=Gryllotalpicola kribbensis TaxID=993084 RepID=A0ABP8B0M1_9MICO